MYRTAAVTSRSIQESLAKLVTWCAQPVGTMNWLSLICIRGWKRIIMWFGGSRICCGDWVTPELDSPGYTRSCSEDMHREKCQSSIYIISDLYWLRPRQNQLFSADIVVVVAALSSPHASLGVVSVTWIYSSLNDTFFFLCLTCCWTLTICAYSCLVPKPR